MPIRDVIGTTAHADKNPYRHDRRADSLSPILTFNVFDLSLNYQIFNWKCPATTGWENSGFSIAKLL